MAGAGDAANADSDFSAALEDAQSPADATASPRSAVKARSSTTAKTPAALPPAVGEAPPEGAAAVADTANPAEAVTTEPAPDKAAASENPDPPDLSQWLPGWPAAAAARVSGAPDPVSAERQDSEVRGGTPIDLLRRERSDLAATGAEPRPLTPSPMATARSAPPLPSAAAMAADAPPAPAARRAAAETPSALPSPALHASVMPATAASVAAAATGAAPPAFEAQLAAALDSAAFAPALATQVSWLVREGVQHARLSLNPAEMGPVTVQIALDGTQARVDFSADLAATRAAIESSLPALAAALHESGLKLAGGGVFDGQPRPGTQSERGQNAARPERDGGPAAAGPDVHGLDPAPTSVQRGLVDLVA